MTQPTRLTAMTDNGNEWHGWSVITDHGRATIHVGPYPDRTSITLYLDTPNGATPLAYFRTPSCARQFLDILDGVFDAGGWRGANRTSTLAHILQDEGGE